MALSLNLSTLSTLTTSTFGSLHSPTPVSTDTPKEDEISDNDEPLLSGSGIYLNHVNFALSKNEPFLSQVS